MLYIFLWIILSLALGIVYVVIRVGRLAAYFAFCEISGALKDFAMQIWIDAQKLWPWKRFNSKYTGHVKDAEDIF